MERLFTIGYERCELEDFLNTLQAAKIDVLLDIRELPLSRRRGFSKIALAGALAARGIAYRHEKRLGTPKAMRQRVRADGDRPRFFDDFKRYLIRRTPLVTALPRELQGNVALMCYEKDPMMCHRYVVAETLAKLLRKKPIHLTVADRRL